MATFYVDPVGGNDANTGTSFATRWQSLTLGATAARIAPGDEIRVIASPDPTNMGQNAIWTQDAMGVVLTSAVTANITLATTAWVPSTFVTSTTSSTLLRKVGGATTQISVSGSFGTGKVAYLDLGSSQDFSAYQQVSFWIQVGTNTVNADGGYELRLCSDATGDVVVNTISIPRLLTAARPVAFTVNTGAALGSNIRSITLWRTVNYGSQIVYLNNILACKASSDVDSLTLNSLISKNTGTEAWYGLQSINGTQLFLSSGIALNQSTAPAPRGYAGTTQTTTLWKREPLPIPYSFTTNANPWGNITDTGTAGNPITYSGGWNRTDMSTKTGKTYIDGLNSLSTGISLPGTGVTNYITITDINLYAFNIGLALSTGSTGVIGFNFTADNIGNCVTGIGNLGGLSLPISSTTTAPNNFTITNVIQHSSGLVTGTCGWLDGGTLSITNLYTNYNYGWNGTASTFARLNTIITNNINNGTSGNGGIVLSGTINQCNFTFENSRNCGNYNFSIHGTDCKYFLTGTHQSVGTVTAIGTGSFDIIVDCSGSTITTTAAGIPVSLGATLGNFIWRNGTINAPSGSSAFSSTTSFYKTIIDNVTLGSGVAYFPTQIASNGKYLDVRLSRPNGVVNNSIYYSPQSMGLWTPDTSIVRTAGGISWRATGYGLNIRWPSAAYPNELPVATVAVDSGSLVTVSLWAYLTNSDNVVRLVCKGGQIAGVPNDVVATSSSGTLNAWQQLTITFTPSAKGAVQIVAQAYGGGFVHSAYIDDFSVTQA